jgi:outer membrane lipoprotein-sorting protein
VTLAAVAALLLQDDASALLKKLEERLAGAKTLQVSLKGETLLRKGDKTGRAAMSGTLRVKAPAKYRVQVLMEYGEQKAEGLLVSDGEKVLEKAGEVERELVPMKDFSARLGGLVARFGPHAAQTMQLRNPDREPQDKEQDFLPDARKLVTIENAKAAKDGDATVLTYAAVYRRTGEEADTRAEMTLVLGKDGLPAKRTAKLAMEAVAIEVTETYTDWKIDAELDDALFALPKR